MQIGPPSPQPSPASGRGSRTASSGARYGGTAIALHWLLAALIVVVFGVGLYMTGLETSPAKVRTMNWHKWAGIAVLALSAARLLWRLAHRPPPPAGGPAWQRQVAWATHAALYVLFFAVPLVGWAYSSAAGFPVVWFGMLPLPDFVPADRDLAEAIKPWHGRLAWTLAALALLHVAGALKHQFVDRDGLLARMWPWAGRGPAAWRRLRAEGPR